MAFDFHYPTPLPSTKGWGPGWPSCDSNNITHSDVFQGGVHERIALLTELLVAEAQRRGYRFHEGWSWGYGCRATKGSTGDTPSFHSWGLALDCNAPENVFGGDMSSSDIAMHNRWLVAFFKEYGFFWLGPDIKDWMHFSFCGSPQDAAAMTAKAQRELGTGDNDVAYEDFAKGIRSARQGDKEPGDKADPDFALGYKVWAQASQTGGGAVAHTHTLPPGKTGPAA
jgi:hypothetical protein